MLNWTRCAHNDSGWWEFDTIELSDIYDEGIYVIWHAGAKPWIVRVGQGKIAECLLRHKTEASILSFRSVGDLYVTWAAEPDPQKRDGYLNYLVSRLHPRVLGKAGEVSAVPPISVNPPFETPDIGKSAKLEWMPCHHNECGWWEFETVDPSDAYGEGIYVIWHAGRKPWVVRVGQGKIAECLQRHRTESSILSFRSVGDLYVTWAAEPDLQKRDSYLVYLTGYLRPRVLGELPAATPVQVNPPFEVAEDAA